MRFNLSACLLAGLFVCPLFAAGEKAYTTVEEAGPDYALQGEYAGGKFGVQVIALGDGRFDAVVLTGGLPGAGWDKQGRTVIGGETKDAVVSFSKDGSSLTLKDGQINGNLGDAHVSAKKIERKSPTLGAKPAAGAIVLFDGSSTDEWKEGRIVEENLLGVAARTKREFRDFHLHLEFRTPFMPKSRGQSRGNSGMYLLDQYECQVLDSFGLEGLDNECGGIYKISRPDVNMCLPPLAWQTYDVDFKAARFDENGNKTSPAVTTIKLNGVAIHSDLELPKATPGGGRSDEKAGGLFLQNHGDPVVYRNIWIVEK
jgi:hypothetical protein